MRTVRITCNNNSFEIPPLTSLRNAEEEHNIGLTFGCGAGACGSCVIKVLKNPNNLTPKTEDEIHFLQMVGADADERLACQCRILGDVEIKI